MQFEKNGEKFSMDVFLAARTQCIQTTNTIIAKIKSGMVEKDIKELIENEFKSIGVQKFWHPTKIRIGTDTTKTFLAESKDTNHLIDSCHAIFKKTAAEWRNKKLTGEALYAYAGMAGHRLGDFPHQLFSSEKLFALNLVPSRNLWILEIHIRDPEHKVGAFFEDILGAEDNVKDL